MNAASYVIPLPTQASLPVVGESGRYPVRRIWCVGRNYLEHIREMGNDERAPPFFFAKHADMLVPDGATIPYPPLTKDLHHEVELIVAMKSGGLNIPADKALDHVYGYAVGIDLTRRDLQIASRKKERPWEIGKSFDYSAPCSAVQPASKIGHPAKGKIWLTVNGKEAQKGDLTELIWNVPEIIWQLSQQVKLAAGDIIMTGTPAGVSAAPARRQARMRRRRRRYAEGLDRPARVRLTATPNKKAPDMSGAFCISMADDADLPGLHRPIGVACLRHTAIERHVGMHAQPIITMS
ncbi:fumarylpyruvate hydrolase [Bradyrhizobium sp. F1.13.4]